MALCSHQCRKTGALAATLPSTLHYGVSALSGWPSVSVAVAGKGGGGGDSKFDLQLVSQSGSLQKCFGRSSLRYPLPVAGMLSNQVHVLKPSTCAQT